MAEAQVEGYKMILGIADDFQASLSEKIEEKRSLLLKKIEALVTKNGLNGGQIERPQGGGFEAKQ